MKVNSSNATVTFFKTRSTLKLNVYNGSCSQKQIINCFFAKKSLRYSQLDTRHTTCVTFIHFQVNHFLWPLKSYRFSLLRRLFSLTCSVQMLVFCLSSISGVNSFLPSKCFMFRDVHGDLFLIFAKRKYIYTRWLDSKSAHGVDRPRQIWGKGCDRSSQTKQSSPSSRLAPSPGKWQVAFLNELEVIEWPK